MPSHRRKPMQITVDGETIELSPDLVKFYLKETRKRIPHRKSVERFFNNMMRNFTVNFFSVE